MSNETCKNRASRPSQGTAKGAPSLNDLAVDGTFNTTNQPTNQPTNQASHLKYNPFIYKTSVDLHNCSHISVYQCPKRNRLLKCD